MLHVTLQVVLRNCGTVRLELDLASLRRDAARITDLSFQSMDSLTIRFRLGRGVVVLLVTCCLRNKADHKVG